MTRPGFNSQLPTWEACAAPTRPPPCICEGRREGQEGVGGDNRWQKTGVKEGVQVHSLKRQTKIKVVFVCLLFYAIAAIFQLYHGGDMISDEKEESLSLHFYQLKGSLTSHTI